MRVTARWSIARRLASINIAASGTALVLACLMLMVYDFITFRQTLLTNRLVQAQIIGSNTVSALTFDDPATAEATLAALRAAAAVDAVGLYRPDGQLFASYLRQPGIEPLTLPETPADKGEWYRFDGVRTMHVIHRVYQDGRLLAIVYIRSDLNEVRDRLAAYTVIVVFVVLLSILAAQVVARLATRSISEPITALATLASALSTTRDYSVRATATGRGEIAVLITAFNEMLAQIQERDRSLRDSHVLLEKRVDERTEALNDSNKELEAFCYSVSHDLRSPLRSIDGFSQALLEDMEGSLTPDAMDHLARIRAATQRMGTLIDDLLNLSRISRTELTQKPVDMSALAQGIIDEHRALQPDRQVQVVIAPNLGATGDPRLVRQILENLLGNAWKFTSKKPDARIEFGVAAVGGRNAFFVRDNGAGFDPAYADRLFGVFQRMHAMTEFPGTGVGLAIVDRIVRRHGGRVWADAAVNRGATFYFSLGPGSTARSSAA